ncbi:hypothetical protein cce_5055 [Crocosphaera subtropica ATCC 51142]|uniref:Transposase n=1 Tax=Crocosphaera subtropica (strain ATCC 51142 / BH68) TaxID=43989 RepID=B1X2P0_CROS5|nr:DUF6262 family protein [Crocosphaera subtropica]ACB54401.1 hypothetical protein cce_5055 [Crocosphaera subtropica ATCC 51142]
MRSQKQVKHCQKIAANKREQTLVKALTAISELLEEDQSITLDLVVQKSGISLSWFYKPENFNLKQLIELLKLNSVKNANYLLSVENRIKNLENEISNLKNSK